MPTGSFTDEAIAAVKAKVKDDEHAICGLSGGVDSSVAAVLCHKALGDRLTCIFVDNGLLRAGEREQAGGGAKKIGHCRFPESHRRLRTM